MNIALLYICTGKYTTFWSDFYSSFEKHFIPDSKKHYFVFTDKEDLSRADNVTLIRQECKGFPADSLFRYDMFLSIEQEVKKYDYTFFMNANMLCVSQVDKTFIPTAKEHYLAFTESFGYVGRNPRIFPYERNRKSKAYIPHVKGVNYKYVLGGINGGRTAEYFAFIHEMSQQIRDDDNRGIMAIYHDESHVNRYFFEHPNCKLLSYEYALAEGVQADKEAKIIIRDKTKISSFFDKKMTRGKMHQLSFQIKRLYHYFIW